MPGSNEQNERDLDLLVSDENIIPRSLFSYSGGRFTLTLIQA